MIVPKALYQSTKSRGFTIVELLIVIVVISILATIAIVAYTGIQQRANNTHTISVISSYAKAMKQYAVDNSKYPEPSPGGVTWTCLGTGYPGGLCFNAGGSASCYSLTGFTSGAWYNDALKTYMNNQAPIVNLQAATCGNSTPFIGAAILSNWPALGETGIFYVITGGFSNCGKPSGFTPLLWLNLDNNNVACYIILPKP